MGRDKAYKALELARSLAPTNPIRAKITALYKTMRHESYQARVIAMVNIVTTGVQTGVWPQ